MAAGCFRWKLMNVPRNTAKQVATIRQEMKKELAGSDYIQRTFAPEVRVLQSEQAGFDMGWGEPWG